MINPDMYTMGEYVPRHMGMVPENQKYVMVRQESEGLVLLPTRDLQDKPLTSSLLPNPSR
jgi:hypothetical protein